MQLCAYVSQTAARMLIPDTHLVPISLLGQAATGEAITCKPNPACTAAIARYQAAADALSEAVALHAAAVAESLYSAQEQQQVPMAELSSHGHAKQGGPTPPAAAAASDGSTGLATAATSTKRMRSAMDTDDVQAAAQDQDCASASAVQLSEQLQHMWLSAVSAAAQLDLAMAHL
jgi:hypothetical protein